MATEKTTHTENSLDDFAWDDGNSDFFGIKPSTSGTSGVIAEVKGNANFASFGDEDEDETPSKLEDTPDDAPEPEDVEVPENLNKKPKVKAEAKPKVKETKTDEDDIETEDGEEDEEEPFFGAKPETTKTKKSGEDEESGESQEQKPEFFDTLTKEFKQQGIFSTVEIDENKQYTEEEFFELHDAEIEGRVQETFEQFFGEMDEDGKAFLKFKKDGGSTEAFLAAYKGATTFNFGEGGFDSNKADHQKQVIRQYLKTVKEESDAEIDEQLTFLEETGKLKAKSEDYFEKLKKADEKQRAALLKQQETEAKAKEDGAKEFASNINKVISETESIGDFKITDKEKKELGPYMTKPSVKVGKNKFIPAFNSQLGEILQAKTPEAKKKLVLLAKLIKSDFDVSDLARRQETKVVKKTQSKLAEAKTGVKPSTSGSYSKKSLSDFF